MLNLRTGAVCGVVVVSKVPAHPDGALAIHWSAIEADLRDVLAANRAFHLQDRRWDAAAASRRERLRSGCPGSSPTSPAAMRCSPSSTRR